MIISKCNCNTVYVIDNKTGAKYEIGTTKILFKDGSLDTQFSYYSFQLKEIYISNVTNKLKFTLYRQGMGNIGNEETHSIEFVLKEK